MCYLTFCLLTRGESWCTPNARVWVWHAVHAEVYVGNLGGEQVWLVNFERRICTTSEIMAESALMLSCLLLAGMKHWFMRICFGQYRARFIRDAAANLVFFASVIIKNTQLFLTKLIFLLSSSSHYWNRRYHVYLLDIPYVDIRRILQMNRYIYVYIKTW